MFIFADLWRVVFDTTITRSFPGDPYFHVVTLGAFWLVLMNSAILTWLGIESGFSVVSSAGEFKDVLFNSLANFIILELDDQALPLVRFIVEEVGHLDHEGWLKRDQLDKLTHGSQYYKPGYGTHWGHTIRHAPSRLLRAVAVIMVPIALGIVVVPVGVVLDDVFQSYVKC